MQLTKLKFKFYFFAFVGQNFSENITTANSCVNEQAKEETQVNIDTCHMYHFKIFKFY